jgi:IS5 family transposase
MPQQTSPIDLSKRYKKLFETKPFLEDVNKHVDWELFRDLLEDALGRKSRGGMGRPPYDIILMVKIIILQSLYNISDEEIEYQILDRLSFMRFLGLGLHDPVPDAKTIWLFREDLRKANVIEKLFDLFNNILCDAGFSAKEGQIIDSSFVEVPIQHNSAKENEIIKQGKIPEEWSKKKRMHKDTDARWTKKNKKSYFGYKNHINIDRKYKLIRRYTVTEASVHDSKEADSIIDKSKEGENVWGDSAYRSEEQELKLKESGLISQIHERSYRNTPLTEEQKKSNTKKSSVRARVEHIFGHVENSMNGYFIRIIGIARAKVKIGLKNLAYNISRLVFLKNNASKESTA